MRVAAAIAAAVALVTAASAAAVTGYPWRLVVSGTTLPSGSQPSALIAQTRAQEARWLRRLSPAAQGAVTRVDLARDVVVAVFLDGMPCAQDVHVTTVYRSGSSLVVRVKYTPPRVGVATCVRTSTAFDVIELARTTLGRRIPSRVSLDLRARA